MFGWKGFGAGKPRLGVAASTADGAPGETSAAVASADEPFATDRLVVGRDLTFHGIASCDHLVVAGRVVADLDRCRLLEIAPGGRFDGSATVEDAEIAGSFEGELTVTGFLHIRAGARVRGRIAYGRVAIEPGGMLLGTVESAAARSRPQPRVVVLPLRPALEGSRHDA